MSKPASLLRKEKRQQRRGKQCQIGARPPDSSLRSKDSSTITHQVYCLSTWASSYHIYVWLPTPPPPQRPPIMIIHSPSLVEFDFLCPLSHNSLQLSDRHANECSVCLGPLFWSISAVSGRRATLWKKQQRELLNTTSPLFGNVII